MMILLWTIATITTDASDGLELPIWIRISGAENLHYLEVPGQGTVGDLIDIIRDLSPPLIPLAIDSEDIVVSVTGTEMQDHSTLFADAGVSQESVVDIAFTSDIEKLFYIFNNPNHTLRIFGFRTYNELVSAYGSSPSGIINMENGDHLVNWTEVMSEDMKTVVHLQIRMDNTRIEQTTINWDVIKQFKHLKSLEIVTCRVTGEVPLDKLPQSLAGLDLQGNELTAITSNEQDGCIRSRNLNVLIGGNLNLTHIRNPFPNVDIYELLYGLD